MTGWQKLNNMALLELVYYDVKPFFCDMVSCIHL